MKKICLDAGHGGAAAGAVYRGLLEKDITLSIVSYMVIILRSKSYDVVLTREGDYGVSLQERCQIANDANCELFISMHCNADPDPDQLGMLEAKGEEIWYYEPSVASEFVAQTMAEAVNEFFPDEPFRGIKGTTKFYVLRETEMPAVLIECGFIDASDTANQFSDPEVLKRIAELIVKGIDKLASV